MVELHKIAFSSNHRCFICRQKSSQSIKLVQVSSSSICEVFLRKKLIIAHGSRCCKKHVDQKNNLKQDILDDIDKKIPISYQSNTLTKRQSLLLYKLPEYQSQLLKNNECDTNHSIIEMFKSNYDIEKYLDDDTCKSITGFKKIQFMAISQKINEEKTLKNSNGRSVSQCLAIYLNWLKTNASQKTIGLHFNHENPIDQRTISDYLDSARIAINKTFVLKKFGLENETRESLLKHVSPFVKELFNLNDNQLVIIADGTYLYCEKSFDNNFQYKTFSGQLKCHLVKPFLLCSTDGYIIDCFPYFPAISNDASILLKILNEQPYFSKLIQKNDIFILDRGFRDAVDILRVNFQIDVKIPTCFQSKKKKTNDNNSSSSEDEKKCKKKLNKKQLTYEEANDSRFVTKCRYIIEVINGTIKQSFKALSSTRNRLLGHLGIDYRISCMFINEFFERRLSDGVQSIYIAKEMKRRVQSPIDQHFFELHSIVNKRKSSKDFIKAQDIDLDDFPVKSLNNLILEISLGSYQIKTSMYYLPSLIKSEILIQKISTCKIITCNIQSRHQFKKMYHPLVKYDQNSILGKSLDRQLRSNLYKLLFNDYIYLLSAWACDCKSGLRYVGCCSHCCALILYCSFAKHQDDWLEFITEKSKLKNSILINMNDTGLNNHPPSIKRTKRFTIQMKASWPSEISNLEIPKNFQILDYNQLQTVNKYSNSHTKNVPKIINNHKKKTTIKRVPKKGINSKSVNGSASQSLTKTDEFFYKHIANWGGFICEIDFIPTSYNLSGRPILNTCSIDYLLQAIWYSTYLSSNISRLIDNLKITTEDSANGFSHLQIIIDYIDKLKWDKARTIWVLQILNLRGTHFDVFGSEYEFLTSHLIGAQYYEKRRICQTPSCLYVEITKSYDMNFTKDQNNQVQLDFKLRDTCRRCKETARIETNFFHEPPFLFISINEIFGGSRILLTDLPEDIQINNFTFKLLCFTINTGIHFKGIFILNNSYKCIDDKNRIKKSLPIPNDYRISTCFYFNNSLP